MRNTAEQGWTLTLLNNLSDSLFPFVLFILWWFHCPLLTNPKKWFIMTPLTKLPFVLFCKTSPRVLSLSPWLSLLRRASVLWLLPSCISSSWRRSAGCWQRRGSPTWPSLARWGHDSFASVSCASAGVSSHGVTQHYTLVLALRPGRPHQEASQQNSYVKYLVLEAHWHKDYSQG